MEFISSNKMGTEIKRVLKPGGQIGIGAWIEQSDIDWITQAFKEYLPIYEDVSKKDIICYAREKPEGQKAILQDAGFEKIQTKTEKVYFISPDRETWWRQMKQAAYGYFKKVPDSATLRRFKEQVFANLESYECPEGIRFHKTVSFAFGVKPG
jgi:hypothetical protein